MATGSGSPGSSGADVAGLSDADTDLRRGPWSSEEDEILLGLVESHGPSNWVVIAHSLETRSAKQCRERYHQNLKPSLDHSPLRPEEAELIDRLVDQIGHRWAEIARRLPGRSDNTIKNWWNGKQNRISRNEHLRSTHTTPYQSMPGSPHHHDHASGSRLPQTPSQGEQFLPPSLSRHPQSGSRSPEYGHRYDSSPFPPSSVRMHSSERESAELAPYHFATGGYGDVHSAHHSPIDRALELPPIFTGSRDARPRTPAAFPHQSNQLPGIHTVLPPSPSGVRGHDGRQRSGSSRMALESLISR